MKKISTLLLLTWSVSSFAQSEQFAFRIQFTDKNATTYSLDAPEAFISSKAIERRIKFGLSIDSTDLPVVQSYIDDVLTATDGIIHNTSRWMNQCVLLTNDSASVSALSTLPFVADVRKVAYYADGLLSRTFDLDGTGAKPTDFDDAYYGSAWNQIHLCNGEWLHEQGLTGKDMTIAVLDIGFPGVNTAAAFDSMRANGRLKDVYNFIYNDSSVFEGDAHGTKVLSTMAAYLPETFVGTAPEANYLLYATDHASTEQLIEENNWIAAAERADSAGADLINSSLGYNFFDNPDDSYTYEQLNGSTTLFARAANMATRKGILVVTSAGNEGMTSWEHILTPGDADSALTVGSVNIEKSPALNSGTGPNAAGLLKPNVCVMGVSASSVTSSGSVVTGSGTSYATPILCGMAACLMQSAPNLLPHQIRAAIEQTADHYEFPNNKIGFGVPDFHKALDMLATDNPVDNNMELSVYPNPTTGWAHIKVAGITRGIYQFTITDVSGRVIARFDQELSAQNDEANIDLNDFSNGLYFIHVQNGIYKTTFKLVKM
jgi:serine protease AprX